MDEKDEVKDEVVKEEPESTIIDENVVELETDDDDDDEYLSNQPRGKSRILRLFIVILMGIFVLFLIIFLSSYLFRAIKQYSYEEVENILKKAAVSYFKDNADSLPKNSGGVVEVDASTLAENGKMKELSSYTKSDSCTGSVQVENENDTYIYRPYLDCGDLYKTEFLYERIIKDNPPVTSGYGLYSKNGSYSFRGEVVNNYVKLDGRIWRVVKIASDNSVELVLERSVNYTSSWDDRYNQTVSSEFGINDYENSRVKEFLDKSYLVENIHDSELLVSLDVKEHLTSFDLCVGKRDLTTESVDNRIECSKQFKGQKVGLLTLSDYLNASTDSNCKGPSTKSCKNYNYLVNKANFWLMTGSSSDTYSVFMVRNNGDVDLKKAYSVFSVRPVIRLDNRTIYESGTGIPEDPYIIK